MLNGPRSPGDRGPFGFYYAGNAVLRPEVRSAAGRSDHTARVSAPRTCAYARRDHALDPAPDVEVAHDLHPRRLRRLREIVEDPVHRALVEDPVVPEAPQIELETLQLDADVGWHVGDVHRREVGRAALELPQLGGIRLDPTQWTQRGELRALHRDLVAPTRVRGRKRLQQLWSWHA